MDIGRAALQAAMRAHDGRGPRTRLLPLLHEHLGDWPAIRRLVYGEDGRAVLASLVPVAVRAARAGDAVARHILSDAGVTLGELALAVARALGMTGTRFDLYTVGGVFAAGKWILAPLPVIVHRTAPRCSIRPPALPPTFGAVLLAMETAGAPTTSAVLRNLLAAQEDAGPRR